MTKPTRMPKGKVPTDNTDEPRYTALSCDGEFVDADDNLDELVRVLAELVDANDGEDLVVWRGQTVAAVIQSSGQVTRFEAEAAAPPPAGRKPAKRTRTPP